MSWSNTLRTKALGTSPVSTLMASGFIAIYSAPTNPNPAPEDALTGATLLATLTLDGDGSTGLSFGTAVNGGLPLASGHTMSGLILATGTAALYRAYESSDSSPAGASTTKCRDQGTIGTANADMILQSVALVANGTNTVGVAEYELDLN